MKRSLLIVSALMMLVVMGSLPKAVMAQDSSRIDELIANAKTPEDHEKIAKFFDEQAAKAEKEAEWHKKLLKAYKNNPRLSTEQMHCSRLVGVYKNEAKEDRALAQEYRDMK